MQRLPLVTLAELVEPCMAAPSRLTSLWEGGAFAIRDTAWSSAHRCTSSPFAQVRRLFDRCDGAMQGLERKQGKWAASNAQSGARGPHLCARFWRGLLCPEGREQFGNGGFDRKRTIDLTSEALFSHRLLKRLGSDFEHIQSFFASCEEQSDGLVPLLAASLQRRFGLAPAVLTGHRMHRLLDYREELVGLIGPRCHPHLDFGSFTVLWTDGVGLEVLRRGNVWAEAPPGAAVVVAGSALSVLTAGRIFAPPHRVVAPRPEHGQRFTPRRTSIALFVEPAKAELLKPVEQVGVALDMPELTYAELKQRRGIFKPL